jgi:hypothetical protein
MQPVSAECVAELGGECIGIVLSDHRHHAPASPRRTHQPVAASLAAVTSGLAGTDQTATGPRLFALVTALDRQVQRGAVSRAGLAELVRGE